MKYGCKRCGSKHITVNGLFYKCVKCGYIDDSHFEMIMERSKVLK